MHLESINGPVFRVSSFPLKLALWADEKEEKKYIHPQLHEAHTLVYRCPKLGIVHICPVYAKQLESA